MINSFLSKIPNKFIDKMLSFTFILSLLIGNLSPVLVFANEDNTQNIEPEIVSVSETEIITGDSVSIIESESQVNTNEIITDSEMSQGEVSDNNENNPTNSSSTDTYETPTSESEVVSIDIINVAETINNSTSTSNTGSNVVSGDSITQTGDAVSYIDLVNVVNTNIVNSTGLIDFIRNVLGYEDFDMRDTFTDIFKSLNIAESTQSCSENICDSNSFLVDLVNQASIYNDISVTANTGNNFSEGTSNITTGNAYATANIVNLANTNIIDSNYLLLVFDNFSDMTSSLVLPNSDFFKTLFSQNNKSTSQLNINNQADISNQTETIANTGENKITNEGTNVINTGNANSFSHIDNLVNQNLLNTNSFSMLIRVHGNWTGDIFGLPEGMQWENTSDGIRLYYNPESNNSDNNSNLVNITNDANITNNVKVFALTGDNEIGDGNEGSNHINTGNAYANSTIFNMANTNLVGSNWINLIFNIYGNWSGDLAFGQPDLWLGLRSQNVDRMFQRPGSQINYIFTVFNHGDVTAKNVILENEFPVSALKLSSPYQNIDQTDGKAVWSIGDIKAGETKEFTVPAYILESFAQNSQLPLPFYSYVYSNQKDANLNDNSDNLLLYVRNKSKKNNPSKTFLANFEIEKTADKNVAKAGDSVNYTIKLENKGGPIFNSLLVDILRDSDGNVLSEQEWPLAEIKNGEVITITYTVNLPKNIKGGIYTNTAQLVGLQGSNSKKYQTPYESKAVTHDLAVGDVPEGEMLSLNISSCSPYLTTYPRQYQDNDESEVVKLQNFLKQHVSTDMVVTGLFDDNTRLAVEKFQQQFSDEILKPWNMSESSGYVYYTTQKKINEIMCDYKIEFPLTDKQKQEIEYFKDQKGLSPNRLLFSSNSLPDNMSDLTTNESSAEIVFSDDKNTNYKPLPTFLQSPLLEDNLSFTPLRNWIYLFHNTKTAYLY